MKLWFWSQAILAGLIVIYGILAAVYFSMPDEMLFPINNIIGLFGMPFFALGVVVSLIVNQLIMSRRPTRVVTRRETILLAVQFTLVVASFAALIVEDWFLEIMAIWVLTIGTAIAACVVIAATSSRLSRESRAVDS